MARKSTPIYDPEKQATGDISVELPDFFEVDLDEEGDVDAMMESTGGVTIDPETGAVIAEEETTTLIASDHETNLAELIDEKELDEIGGKLAELIEADDESRAQWYERIKRGIENLGIYGANGEDVSEKTEGVTRITHPLIMEAVTQFQARAMSELLPSKGPVKVGVLTGEVSQELLEQAERVQHYMNYQLTVEDRDYYDEREQMLYMLSLTGSEFDKQYYCPIEEKVRSVWIRCDDFIVNNNARSLKKAPRRTHVLHYSKDEYDDLVAHGLYMEQELEAAPPDHDNPVTTALVKIDEGSEASGDELEELCFYECHTRLTLPEGIDGGKSAPYIITLDKGSGKVLAIYRNWKPTDPKRKERSRFTHKKYLPGFGFYGFGLLHVIGTLGEAATQILNILLDSGAYSSLQGGFKSKDAKLNGDIELVPGQWTDTEMTAEELAKAFYTPPFKEPSQVLTQVLGTLTSLGQRFASTTEVMVGDAGTSGPVGNVVAQIEQGSKVFSGIHRRLHKAFGDEFMHIAELNGEHLPDAYPFKMKGKSDAVLRADFDDRIDVIPVSDPNIFSSAQRIAMAQTALDIAGKFPQLNPDVRGAVIEMLTAMNFPDPERLFPAPPDPSQIPRMDPITEGAQMGLGKPVKAFIDQNHQAHITVHQAQIAMLQQSQPEKIGPVAAHMSEHIAMDMFNQLHQQMMQAQQQQAQQMMQAQQAQAQQMMMQGMTPPMPQQPPPPAHPGMDWQKMEGINLDPAQENMIALQAASAAQQILAQLQQQNDPEAAKQAEQQAKMQVSLQEAQIAAQSSEKVATINAQAKIQEATIRAQSDIQNSTIDAKMNEAKLAMMKFEAMLEDRRKREEVATTLRMERELLVMKLQNEQDMAARQQMESRLTDMDARMTEEPEDDDREESGNMRQMLAAFQTAMSEVVDKLNQPKRIVMDAAGRPVGVEPVGKE
jgi:hypothetical protein